MLLVKCGYNNCDYFKLLFSAGTFDADNVRVDNFYVLFLCMQKLVALGEFNKDIYILLIESSRCNYFGKPLGVLLNDHDNVEVLDDFVGFLVIMDRLHLIANKSTVGYIFADSSNLKLNIRLFTLLLEEQNSAFKDFFVLEIGRFFALFSFLSNDLSESRMSILQCLIRIFNLKLLGSNNFSIMVESLKKFNSVSALHFAVGCFYNIVGKIKESALEVPDAMKTEFLQFLIFLSESGSLQEEIMLFVNRFVGFGAKKLLSGINSEAKEKCFNNFMLHLARLRELLLLNVSTFQGLINGFTMQSDEAISCFSARLSALTICEDYMREFNVFCAPPGQQQAAALFAAGGGSAAAPAAARLGCYSVPQ